MCYAVILDLTTCLHRMVRPFQQMPVQHLPPKHRRRADLAERFFRTIAESRDVDPSGTSATVTRASLAPSTSGDTVAVDQRWSAISSSAVASRTNDCPHT